MRIFVRFWSQCYLEPREPKVEECPCPSYLTFALSSVCVLLPEGYVLEISEKSPFDSDNCISPNVLHQSNNADSF